MLDNVSGPWLSGLLALHRAVPGPQAFTPEVLLIVGTALLALGIWGKKSQERLSRLAKAHTC